MNTQLRAWSIGVLEASALVAVTSVPVFVNFYGFRVFELGKGSLTIAIALLAALAGIVALVEGRFGGMRPALRQPLVLAALLLWVATAIATALSIVPSLSFFGSSARAEGLLALTAALVIFGAVAAVARGEDRRRRIVAVLLAGTVPVALFALTQALGIEVVPGKVESAGRAFGTLSNPIFLGAYLMLVLPLTLVETLRAHRAGRLGLTVALAVLATVQLVGLAVTASRGPQLGLLVGLVALGLGVAAAGRRRILAAATVVLAAGVVVVIVLLNQQSSPLAPIAKAPIVGRYAEIGDVGEGSQATRLKVWEAVDRLVKSSSPERLLVGNGPETLKYVLLPHTGPYVGGKGQSDRLVDRAHSVPLDDMVSTGVVGLAARLLVFGAWLFAATMGAGLLPGRSRKKALVVLLVAGTALGALAKLVPQLAPYGWAFLLPGMLAGFMLYLLGAAFITSGDGEPDGDRAQTDSTAGPSVRDVNVAGPALRAANARLLSTGLLAAGAAAAAEATFGIETVVTQLVFWALAGMVVALALGEPAQATTTEPRGRGARREAEPEPGTVTITWSPGGAAIGVAVGAAMGLLLYDFVLYGAVHLPAALPVALVLAAATWLAGIAVATSAGESGSAAAIAAAMTFVIYAGLRGVTLAAADDAAVLYAVTVVWLLLLALLAGWIVRDRFARAPVISGPVAILYPLLAVVAAAMLFTVAVRPVQADIYFQSALANFDAASSITDEQQLEIARQRYAAAETLFDRASALNPREDTYHVKRAEAYTMLGSMSPDLQTAAHWFQRAQEEIGLARDLDPLMPYHKFNHGHMQLVFAQMVDDKDQRARFAADAEVNLQQAFDAVPYDPQVANELALAKILQGDYATGVSVLQYVLDALDSENAMTYKLLARAYAETGLLQEADSAMQRAIELGSASPDDLVALGDAARRNDDLETAVHYYERAISQGEKNWAVFFNLALMYRDLGRTQDAVETLTAAAQLAPSESELAQIQAAMQKVLEDSAGIPETPGMPQLPPP